MTQPIEKALHEILIVGGGAGGLELAAQLGNSLGKNKQAKITLIDQNLTHVWKPLLHEIAAGTLNPHAEEVNYFAHASKHHYEFILGRFVGLDQTRKQIKIESRQPTRSHNDSKIYERHYDTLIMAIGSTSNDFATEGAQAYCHFIDSRQQADLFQQDLLQLYLDAQHSPTPSKLNIAIIGAGATGVELAAELVHAKRTFSEYGLNKIDPTHVHVTLIEAADRILPALSAETAAQTHTELDNLGIHILTKHRVAKIDEKYIYFTDDSKVEADLKVWAAGIKAPEVLTTFENFEKDGLGRLKVYATLQTYSDPHIFAFGDCAHCQPATDEPVLGPRAQVASQQATFLVRALKAHIQEKSLPMFKFHDKGALVSLSRYTAVGELMGQINVHGVVAKTMYLSLYRLHQATLHGYTQAGLMTVKDLMNKKVGPKIKLH